MVCRSVLQQRSKRVHVDSSNSNSIDQCLLRQPRGIGGRAFAILSHKVTRSALNLDFERLVDEERRAGECDSRHRSLPNMMTEANTIELPRKADSLPTLSELTVAVFHDNFAQMGGAERVAEAIYEALPGAHLHSTLSAPEILSKGLQSAKITNTWMNRLPYKAKLFRAYFLLYPLAVDHVDLSAYDLVVTSCFGYAKGVHRRAGRSPCVLLPYADALGLADGRLSLP